MVKRHDPKSYALSEDVTPEDSVSPIVDKESVDTNVPKKQEATNLISGVETDKRSRIHYLHVDPKLIRIREDHDRDYSALDEDFCNDLISGFQGIGQQIPAIVIEDNSDDDYKWQLVCGARRHWTASFLKIDLIVKVENLDDMGIFLLTDQENNYRKDISDYERGKKYLNAISGDSPLLKSISQLSKQVPLGSSMLGYLLKLARAPQELIRVIKNINTLTERNYRAVSAIALEPNSDTLKKDVTNFLKTLEQKSVPAEDLVKVIKTATQTKQTRTHVNKASLHHPKTGKITTTIKDNPNKPTITIEVGREYLSDLNPIVQHIESTLEKLQQDKDNT